MALVAVSDCARAHRVPRVWPSRGRARVRCNVPAPATTGHPVFERYFRVQQNTLEQLIVFVPSMWLFGLYVSAALGRGSRACCS